MRLPRPPRVVFVLGLVSLINSLTSGKNGSVNELYYLRPVKDYQSRFLKNGRANTYF